MKIAIYHNLPSGGAKRALYEVVRRLSQSHTLEVFNPSTANRTFCDLKPFVAQEHVFEYHPLKLFQSPFGRLNQFQRWRDIFRMDRLAASIAAQVDAGEFDVVYVHPCMWTQAPAVLNYLLTPSVYHIQEVLRKFHEPEIPRPYLRKHYQRLLNRFDPILGLYKRTVISREKRYTRSATKLLANSAYTAMNAEQIYGLPVDICYFGVDGEEFRPFGNIRKQDFVLSVGAFIPTKGFDFLIRAIGHIPSNHRPTLRIIGNMADPAEVKYLEDTADRHRVELIIETMVGFETLVKRYSQAALVLYAPIREPFGLVALEAMACGTAVIGVDEGGVRETVIHGETGMLIPRDEKLFAEAVQELIGDRWQLEKLGRRARESVVANWEWGSIVKRIEDQLIEVSGREDYSLRSPTVNGTSRVSLDQ